MLYLTDDDVSTHNVHFLSLLELTKLLLVARLKDLTKGSDVIRGWWERQNVANAMCMNFMGQLLLVSVSGIKTLVCEPIVLFSSPL